MDELQISGRRYVSSRRAAQMYRYHTDYIGQLVRGGKVKGQKVGRAWYIDAESLRVYLEGLGGAGPAPEVAAREPESAIVPEPTVEVKPEPAKKIVVEEKVAEPVEEILQPTPAVEEKIEEVVEEEPVVVSEHQVPLIAQKIEEEISIPVRISIPNKQKLSPGLRYEEGESLPQVRKTQARMQPEAAEEISDEENIVITPRTRGSLRTVLSFGILGMAAFALAISASYVLQYSLHIEGGVMTSSVVFGAEQP
ncbi:MAG: hypothetical protein KGI70_03060 [Patescibacteria group bacterium]|nr:hypothetical protein [Patescibacteria group bacterium]